MPSPDSSFGFKKLLILSFILLTTYVVANRNWLNTRYPLQMDANGYYVYLPAIFIYQDLERLSFVDQMSEQFDRKYFLYPGANGGYMTKYTPGMAILELPFFVVAHFIAPFTGFEADGYSPPYRLAIALSTLFYTFLGLWLLGKLLERYFSPTTVSVTVLTILFGTNLLFYSSIQAAITHNYVFFSLMVALYYGDNWTHSQHWKHFALSCAGAGFAALIRPTEILIAGIPFGILLAKLYSQNDWKKELKSLVPTVILGGICFSVFLLPIFIYWKFSTGNWVAYTYEQEGFYFDRPWQIWLGLFGFRKGWFIYTPVLFLSLIGLKMMWNNLRFKHIRSAFLWYLPINLYIVLSWYGWWYGGCFGLRALIPALGIMATPIALFLENTLKSRRMAISFALCGFFIVLNIFQSYQYQRQILHMDSMTWRSYLYIFGKWKLDEREKAHMKTLLDYANYNERGKKLSEYFE